MRNPLSWLKNRLSHVNSTSWHYRLVKDMWGDKTQGKACSFYWIKLPSSMAGVTFICLIAFVITEVCLFFGYVVTFFEPSEEMKLYETDITYPYKTFSNGKRFWVAPWEVALAIAVLWVLNYLVFVDPALGLKVLVTAGIILIGCLLLIGYMRWRVGHLRRSQEARRNVPLPFEQVEQEERRGFILPTALGMAWDRICPPLVVEEKET